MRGRRWLGLFAGISLATSLPVAAGPEPPQELVIRYPQGGSGLFRYAFVRQDTVVAAMPNGEEQTQIIGRTAYLTLTWIASDSGTKITAAIDSLVPAEGVSRFDPVVDSALGARWAAWRHPDGTLTHLDPGSRSSVAEQVRDQFRLLFPILPLEGASPGRSWGDSTEGPALVSAFEARERVKLTSRAEPGPDGSVAIDVVRERAADGEGLQYLQPITVTATGTDSLSYTMTEDGVVHDVAGRRLVHLDLDLPAVGQRVSARVCSFLGMRLLP
jgi:hypothetical protein